jgi:drug/metabolite transporter (DMT)-like permease
VGAQILLLPCCVRSCPKISLGIFSHAAGLGSYFSGILLLLFGDLVWGEVPVGLVWLGGLLIIAGGLLPVKSR